jgi:hypothetical protein
LNLSNPVAPTTPGSGFAAWLDQFPELTEAQRDPLADPADDGVEWSSTFAEDARPR